MPARKLIARGLWVLAATAAAVTVTVLFPARLAATSPEQLPKKEEQARPRLQPQPFELQRAQRFQLRRAERAGRGGHPFAIWDGTTDPRAMDYLGELQPAASVMVVPPLGFDKQSVEAGWPVHRKIYEEHLRLGIDFVAINDLEHHGIDMPLADLDAAVRKAVKTFSKMKTIMIGCEADGGCGPKVSSRPRDYALRVRVAYRAVKAVRESCRVAVGGTGGNAKSYGPRPQEAVAGNPLSNPGYFDAVFGELERLEAIENNPQSYDWKANPLGLSKEDFKLVFSPDAYQKYQDIHHISLFVHDHTKYRDQQHLGVIRAVKALLFDYGYRDTEIWITQAGTHSGTIKSKFLAGPPQTERQQAASLVKQYLVYRSWGVKRIFWTSTVEMDWPEEFGGPLGAPGNPQHYFSLVGLVHNGKGQGDPGHGVRKLSFHTYRFLVEKLGRGDWDHLELVRDDGAVVFRLRVDGKPVYVAWREAATPGPFGPFPPLVGRATQRPVSVSLAIGGKAARVTSLIPAEKQGKEVRGDRPVFPSRGVEAVDSRVTLELSEEPVLIEQESDPPADRLPQQKERAQTHEETDANEVLPAGGVPRNPPRGVEPGPRLRPQANAQPGRRAPASSVPGRPNAPVYFLVWDHVHFDEVDSPAERRAFRAQLELFRKYGVRPLWDLGEDVVRTLEHDPESLRWLGQQDFELGYHFHPNLRAGLGAPVRLNKVRDLEWHEAVLAYPRHERARYEVASEAPKKIGQGFPRVRATSLDYSAPGGLPFLEAALGKDCVEACTPMVGAARYVFNREFGIDVVTLDGYAKQPWWSVEWDGSDREHNWYRIYGMYAYKVPWPDQEFMLGRLVASLPREDFGRLKRTLAHLDRSRARLFQIGSTGGFPGRELEGVLRYLVEEFFPANPGSRFVTPSWLMEHFPARDRRAINRQTLFAACKYLRENFKAVDWEAELRRRPWDPTHVQPELKVPEPKVPEPEAAWGNLGPRPPRYAVVGKEEYLSLNECFLALTRALRAYRGDGKLPARVAVEEILPPIGDRDAMPRGGGKKLGGREIIEAARAMELSYPPAYWAVPYAIEVEAEAEKVRLNAAEMLYAMAAVYAGLSKTGTPPATVAVPRAYIVPESAKWEELLRAIQGEAGLNLPIGRADWYDMLWLWSLRPIPLQSIPPPPAHGDGKDRWAPRPPAGLQLRASGPSRFKLQRPSAGGLQLRRAPPGTVGKPERRADSKDVLGTVGLFDQHIHFTSKTRLEDLIAGMDRTHTRWAVLPGTMFGAGPRFAAGPRIDPVGLDDQGLGFHRARPKRFFAFTSGFDRLDPKQSDLKYVQRRLKEGFSGIGEISHPDAWWNGHPVMDRIFRLAALYKVPVNCHMPGEPDRLKAVLARHPDTNFIYTSGWQLLSTRKGFGDQRTPEQRKRGAALLADILAKHKNLYILLIFLTSADDVRQGIIRDDALAVLRQYPDRFILGSDRCNDYDNVLGVPFPQWYKYMNSVLARLPAESARMIARGNLERLLKIDAAKQEAKGSAATIFYQVVVNCNYFPAAEDVDLNCRNIKRHVALMEKYGLKADYYFTSLAGRQIWEHDPTVFERLKGARMTVNHHGANRLPHPMPIERCKGKNWEEDVRAILDYESQQLDPSTGRLDPGVVGGLKGFRQVLGLEPFATGRFFKAPILHVCKQFGVRMCVGIQDHIGTASSQAWFMGVLNRPDSPDLFLHPNHEFLPWALESKGDPLGRLEARISSLDPGGFHLLTIGVHDGDFFQGKTRTEQERLWQKYEEVIHWAAAGSHLKAVTLKEIYAMAIDDRERMLSRAQVREVAEILMKAAVHPRLPEFVLPDFVDLGDDQFSLSDAFQALALSLKTFSTQRTLPPQIKTRDLLGPTEYAGPGDWGGKLEVEVADVARGAEIACQKMTDRIPARVHLAGRNLNAAEFLLVMAQAFLVVERGGTRPIITLRAVEVLPRRVAQNTHVDLLTKLQSWTYKPVRWKALSVPRNNAELMLERCTETSKLAKHARFDLRVQREGGRRGKGVRS